MGGDRSYAVCNDRGESFDVKNLYVADASAMPTASGVNPSTCVSICFIFDGISC